MEKRFSVVIVHRNGAQMLLNTLSAPTQAWNDKTTSCSLVDNGNSDDTCARLSSIYPQTIIIRNRCNTGYARTQAIRPVP
jgi:GT2 family glycosyltransferase